MEFFLCVYLGPRIFILKSIGGQIILNSHWLLKDEEAIDWKERFRSLKGNTLKEGEGGLPKREEYVVWRKGKRRRMNV
jgi:hypothetical protein